VSYIDVIEGRVTVGQRVAIIGAGGIGFDVAELLTHTGKHGFTHGNKAATPEAIAAYHHEWGVDTNYGSNRGGLTVPQMSAPIRELWLLQRKSSKVGDGLAKTTGWSRRLLLQKRGVHMINGVEYVKIDDEGLHINTNGKPQVLVVDTIVICAGQEPQRELVAGLTTAGIEHTLIGGADVAAELDAKRAIWQATEVALEL
jgi:2,4-dienoyl-CoA reductase (NADPH2)